MHLLHIYYIDFPLLNRRTFFVKRIFMLSVCSGDACPTEVCPIEVCPIEVCPTEVCPIEGQVRVSIDRNLRCKCSE